MFRNILHLACSTLVFFGAGCDGRDDSVQDDSSPIRSGSSIVIPGTDTVPPGVDPNETYTRSRSISILNLVARLSTDEKAVIDRADGMIASTPADGRVSLEELAQLAAPSFMAVLSAGEKAAMSTVWRFMRAPKLRRVTMTLPPELSPFGDGDFRAVRPTATKLVRPAERTRFSLNEPALSDGRAAAQRIEYGFNADGDANTIDIADIDGAILSPAFTSDERSSFQGLRAKLQQVARAEADAVRDATPQTMTAPELHGPSAGSVSARIDADGAWSVDARREHRYEEYRSRDWSAASNPWMYPTLTSVEEYSYGASASGAGVLIGMNPQTELESGDPRSSIPVDPAQGAMLEVWSDGEPSARLKVEANGSLPTATSRDLSAYLDHGIVTPKGALKAYAVEEHCTPYHLDARLVYASREPAQAIRLDYSDWTTLHPEATAITQSGDKRGAGHYEFALGGDYGTVRVDVYPSARADVNQPASYETGATLVSSSKSAEVLLSAGRVVSDGVKRVSLADLVIDVMAHYATVTRGGAQIGVFPLNAATRTAW